jgi:hypothetical protein
MRELGKRRLFNWKGRWKDSAGNKKINRNWMLREDRGKKQKYLEDKIK